jgi:hypothetical protein
MSARQTCQKNHSDVALRRTTYLRSRRL